MAKAPFRIKPYRHSRLKFVVRDKLTGKWRRKFFKTEREAKTYVQLKEIELLNQGKEGVMFPAEIRVMAHRAKAQLEPLGKTIDDAVEFYLKHVETEKGSVSVEQAVDELIQNRRGAGRSKLYCGDLKFHLGRFGKEFTGRSVASISTKEINAWLAKLDVGPVTRNTFRRDVRTLFSFCRDAGYCAENPATATTRAKEPSREVEVLSVEDARRLLATSSPELLPYWSIGLFAGLRPSEIRHLRWSNDVDFEDALITVRSTKTGRKRFVKMQPVLLEWLKQCRRQDGKVVSPVNFRKQCAADKAAAGLSDWPVNALRHSFGSYHLAQFGDINALAVQMGNSPEMIERHYRKAVTPKEAHRYWQVKPFSSSAVAKKIVSFPP
jgi:integrase